MSQLASSTAQLTSSTRARVAGAILVLLLAAGATAAAGSTSTGADHAQKRFGASIGTGAAV